MDCFSFPFMGNYLRGMGMAILLQLAVLAWVAPATVHTYQSGWSRTVSTSPFTLRAHLPTAYRSSSCRSTTDKPRTAYTARHHPRCVALLTRCTTTTECEYTGW